MTAQYATPRPSIDQVMANMPARWRLRWCTVDGPCGCMGCANHRLLEHGYTRADWDAWVARQ